MEDFDIMSFSSVWTLTMCQYALLCCIWFTWVLTLNQTICRSSEYGKIFRLFWKKVNKNDKTTGLSWEEIHV